MYLPQTRCCTMWEPAEPECELQNHFPVERHFITAQGLWIPQYAHACSGRSASSYGVRSSALPSSSRASECVWCSLADAAAASVSSPSSATKSSMPKSLAASSPNACPADIDALKAAVEEDDVAEAEGEENEEEEEGTEKEAAEEEAAEEEAVAEEAEGGFGRVADVWAGCGFSCARDARCTGATGALDDVAATLGTYGVANALIGALLAPERGADDPCELIQAKFCEGEFCEGEFCEGKGL